ncbi:MAG: FHA domain-containing protein [Caudoviricetes sp.]|nr:MAG: FHA domain-containing protein [Caudoviricetes sp.]
MSVNFYSYLGPVLEITKDPIEIVNETTICPNEHEVDENDNFCKHCGEKTIKKKKVQFENIDIRKDDETGIFDDLIRIDDNGKIFIFGDFGISLCDRNQKSYEGININYHTIKDMENDFYTDGNIQYMIKYLSEKYGRESYSIPFKLIMYANY